MSCAPCRAVTVDGRFGAIVRLLLLTGQAPQGLGYAMGRRGARRDVECPQAMTARKAPAVLFSCQSAALELVQQQPRLGDHSVASFVRSRSTRTVLGVQQGEAAVGQKTACRHAALDFA